MRLNQNFFLKNFHFQIYATQVDIILQSGSVQIRLNFEMRGKNGQNGEEMILRLKNKENI